MQQDNFRAELIRRAKQDQAMRTRARKHSYKWDESIAHSNAKFLKQVVEKEGWPTISMMGHEASQAAWLIALHADHDVPFQERCLALIHNLPEGEISLANIAALEDRVRINKQLPQIYGTQFADEDGKFGPYPIEDIANLDARRSTMRLEPFAKYRASMLERYNKTPKEK